MNQPGFQVETVSMLYYKNTPLKRALDQLMVAVDRAYRNGANILILSDRGVDENHVAIPSLLAVSAMEQHLVRTKKRTAVSVILESAEPRDVHHFATLLGYGARAINPYLAQETIRGAHRGGPAGQGLPRGGGRLRQRHPPRHREDRLQNGHLHPPVLPVRPDL